MRDHLTDDGVFVLYNYYREDWLIAKIAAMLDDASTPADRPLVRRAQGDLRRRAR